MSIKDDMAALSAGLSMPPTVATKRAATAMTAPAALMAMNGGFRELQSENAKLKESQGRALRVRMDLCDDGPYHTTAVDADRVAALKANLAENPQSTPASVRAKPDGRYEIIAGRHRKHSLLELGHEEWDIVVRDLDDDAAERLTFYDNLLAPSLSDYARFRGFEARTKRHGLTLVQLAKESGLALGRIHGLMSFAKLPPAALQTVEANQSAFGFNLVAKLARLADSHEAGVVQAVALVAAGSLSQEAAPAKVLELGEGVTAQARPLKATAPRNLKRVSVSWEGRDYATVDMKAKVLTIRLADRAEAEAVQKAVVKALQDRAKRPSS